MLRTRDQAAKDLTPIVDRLERIVPEAWAEFTAGYTKLRYRHTKRTEASIFHDLIVAKARELLDGIKGVLIETRRNRTTLTYRNTYRFRFKKLDPHLRPRNIPTQLVLNFLDQQVLPGLPDPVTNLHLGYQTNPTATAISSAWITCPDGSQIEWAWRIDRPAEPSAAVAPAAPRPAPRPVRRVRARKPQVAQEGGESAQTGG